MREQEIKNFDWKLDDLSKGDPGAFAGFLSVYGNVDEGNDVVEKGAFDKTLKESGGKLPLLWHHDARSPIGSIEVEDRKKGLWVSGKLLIDDISQAREAYALLKAEVVKGLSIGFQTIRDEIKDGIRHLKEIRLHEGSIVTFPMNPLAQIVAVKSTQGGDDAFRMALLRSQAISAREAILGQLSAILDKLVLADLPLEDLTEAAAGSIDDFKTAFVSCLPRIYEAKATSLEAFSEMSENRAKIQALICQLEKQLSDDAGTTDSGHAEGTSQDAALPDPEPAGTTSKRRDRDTAETASYLRTVLGQLNRRVPHG